MVRGIRGAITVDSNTKPDIRRATKELLTAIVEANALQLDDVASVFFTGTDDLEEEVPARAARDMGWTSIPMFCSQEMKVRDGLPMCIRAMIHVNTNRQQHEMNHVYLGEAVSLRPDLTQGG